MTTRRLIVTLTRHLRSLNLSFSSSLRSQTLRVKIIPSFQYPQPSIFTALTATVPIRSGDLRLFSSHTTDCSGSEDGDEEEEDDEEGEEGESCEDEDGSETGPKLVPQSAKSETEKVKEASEIGYTVVGSLTSFENPFKLYEPVFAIVQIGSHQFKVSNGDSIFTERLKYCEVNDKLILSKILMLGSRSETIIGRPILPDAAVHAVVEEHALDAKVIIFKKKRRKNYRRTKGHRQELTKLRITDIQGIDKSESLSVAA